MKILFILPSLGFGGAEKVVSFLAKKMFEKKYDVILLVVGSKNVRNFDTGNLPVTYLNKKRLIFSFFSIVAYIHKNKPKVVFTSVTHLNILISIISCFFKKIKFIVRASSISSLMSKYGNNKSRILINTFLSYTYRKSDMVICQSEDMKNDLIRNYNINKDRLYVIGNPITHKFFNQKKNSIVIQNKIRFITVGRLSKEKGHDRILDGLSKITNYDFHYTIIGDGHLKFNIKKLIEKYNMSSKVTFIDFSANIIGEIQKNDFFLQGSFVEGFPNAVLESCSVGVPVIAFDCIGGTKEIINKNNGFLIKNQDEFEELLINLNNLKKPKKSLIVDSVWKKFAPKIIINKYEKLLILNEN